MNTACSFTQRMEVQLHCTNAAGHVATFSSSVRFGASLALLHAAVQGPNFTSSLKMTFA